MRPKRAPRRFGAPRPRPSVQAVVDETIALYQWLAWVSDQIYGDDARGASRRWALRRLQKHGPQTVPQLARSRAICRQSLQPVVDGLVADGLARLEGNPEHARSRLVTVTPKGAAVVAAMDHVDAAVLRAVSRGLGEGALRQAAATLRELRKGFENEARWRTVTKP